MYGKVCLFVEDGLPLNVPSGAECWITLTVDVYISRRTWEEKFLSHMLARLEKGIILQKYEFVVLVFAYSFFCCCNASLNVCQ